MVNLLSAYVLEVMIGIFQGYQWLECTHLYFWGRAVLHSCLLYHFVTFEAKFGHIGVNNPYIWWSVYEHEVMIGMFKDLGSLLFNFGSKAVVQSTSRQFLILLPLRQNMAKSE